MYEIVFISLMLKSLLLNEVKKNIKIDDVRFKSNLTTNKSKKFTKKSFFYTVLGFTQSQSGVLGEIEGFARLIPFTYKCDKPIKSTAIDDFQLKCDCINASIVNGSREPILYSLALDKPQGHKLYKDPRIKRFEKIKKSVLSHNKFYLEDDDRKPLDFNNQTISFKCRLIIL